MPKKAKAFDFEAAIKELEAIVARMEGGELTLEDSLKHFERGVVLVRTCQKVLDDVNHKVKILVADQAPEELLDFDSDSAEPHAVRQTVDDRLDPLTE